MSEQDKQGGTVVGSSHGAEITGKKWSHAPVHARLWGLIISCLIIVAAGTFVILQILHHQHSSTPHNTTTTTSKPKTPVGLVLSGDDAGAQKLLDTQIAAAKTKADKGALYEQKAGIAYSDKDYQASLQFAQQAEALNPTVRSAELIGESAEALGNKSLALKYYKLQLQRMQPVEDRDTLNSIDAKIQSLEGTTQ